VVGDRGAVTVGNEAPGLGRQVAGRVIPGYARLAYVGVQLHNGVIGDAVQSRLLVCRLLVLVCGW
jgi:hypothetical protein